MKAIKKMAVALFLAAIAAGVPHAVAQTPNIVTGERINIGLGNSVSNTNTSYCGALGQSNTVSSLSGFALGYSNNVSGPFGIGIGNTNTVSATNGVAVGMQNNVTVAGSMAFGHRNLVTAPMNIAVGVRTKANSTSSPCIVMGSGFINETGDNAYLTNTTPNSLAVGFSSTVPTLFVGPSPNNYSLGVTDRTGRVAIGNITPAAKLHIHSDDDEDAELVLEPDDTKSNYTKLILHDGLHYIKVDPDDKMEIASSGVLGIEAADISFQGGRLDLGDDSQRKLTLTPSEAPAIYCNAYRDGGIYRRHRPGSSYALEFWTDSLVMRASRNQGERGTQITNWCNALSITTDGHVTLNGQVGVNTANTSQSHALAVDGGLVATNGPVTLNGPVGINTANTTQEYALAVDGGVIATKVRIQLKNDWPDRVFAPDYALRPMEELREYVAVNRHLPGVPSEEEVSEQGIDLGSMQAVLLEKIEELTLYILRQQRDIERLTQHNLRQRSEMDTLKKELEELRGTVRFGYDACGNRVTRTLEVKREDDRNGPEGGHPKESDANAAPAASGDLVGGMAYAIYPNPTEGRLVLVTEGTVPPEGAVATLLTLTGSVMEERVVRSNREELDLSGRPSGVYLLRLSYGNETHTWRVVKND